jgi:hypothetical protein
MSIRLTLAAIGAATVLIAARAAAQGAGPAHQAGAQSGPLGVPMERAASGTTWTPDVVTIPSRHFGAGSWQFMLHGFVFAQYITQGGTRGDAQFGSLNWGMLMASRTVLGGRLQARLMLSGDPATVTGRGYPLLFQSGELWRGEPLRDRQHPHDALMEVALAWERELGAGVGLLFYAAPSGEPALGPVAFMHRPSAMDNPVAPLGHHWQDATHISYGTATAGLFGHRWRLEASAFNGREPDDQRWNFDPIRLDSYSARVTVNPAPAWSFTAGYGYLHTPEARHPGESINRMTASILHGRALGESGQWASALVWGANAVHGGGAASHSALLESEAVLNARHTVFGRAEYAQKSAGELDLGAPFVHDDRFGVTAVTAGYVREVAGGGGGTVGVGGLVTLNAVPRSLEAAYGSRTPLGAAIFIRLRPERSPGHSMGQMGPMAGIP